ncbi:MAG: hypothetical protein JO007_02855 [Alphaproteobacteria bacterium]|nr:hypothetical protein [Alphaproteobacteria bacterium]
MTARRITVSDPDGVWLTLPASPPPMFCSAPTPSFVATFRRDEAEIVIVDGLALIGAAAKFTGDARSEPAPNNLRAALAIDIPRLEALHPAVGTDISGSLSATATAQGPLDRLQLRTEISACGKLGLDWLGFGQGPAGAASSILNPSVVTPTTQSTTAVSAGKYIAPSVSVGVTQGVSPPTSKVTVEVDLGHHITVDTEAGQNKRYRHRPQLQL